MTSFAQVVDATDKLSLGEQQALVEILHRRIAEENRRQLLDDVVEARAEFQEGKCVAATVGDLVKEITS